MLNTLITSRTRKKLLLKFFLNSNSFAYLRHLEDELEESPNSLRIELQKFEKANMLVSRFQGNKKMYMVNTSHPIYHDIRNIILKSIGFDQIIDKVISQVTDLNKVFVLGKLAKGLNSNIIDLLFVGDNINVNYLITLINETERIIDKRIRYLTIKPEELGEYVNTEQAEILLLWDEGQK
jgi:dihydroorotate dehydrogenase